MGSDGTPNVPQVRYARAGLTNIAYQYFGDGPAVMVAVPPMAQNVELAWECPQIRYMLERFGSFCRYLHFDKRGTGASDRAIPVPEVDQRVDDLRAVMDDAGIDRAHLFGTSEGGPMTLLFAATYPDRVESIILNGSGARLTDSIRAHDQSTTDLLIQFADRWGTPESLTVDLFAPSLAGDAEFRKWHERYERQAASRDAILTLMQMNGQMDAREVLPLIDVPVLMLHRVDDPIVDIRLARETAALLTDVRVIELPGADHFAYAGDVDRVLDEIEGFVTGSVSSPRPPVPRPRAAITTLGRFAVTLDGREVPTAAWGSRRARQLLKRLAANKGWPVPRDELIELLWPDDDEPERLRARLSVQLSAVRRILHGGVIADRSSVRLDVEHVDLDLLRLDAATTDEEIVEAYDGEFLPDDRFDDWTASIRTELQVRFLAAAHRVLEVARTSGAVEDVARAAGRILAVDPFDEVAHQALVGALHANGNRPAATGAHRIYLNRMSELGLTGEPLDVVVDRFSV